MDQHFYPWKLVLYDIVTPSARDRAALPGSNPSKLGVETSITAEIAKHAMAIVDDISVNIL